MLKQDEPLGLGARKICYGDVKNLGWAVPSPSRPQGQAPGKLPIFFPIFPFSSHFP